MKYIAAVFGTAMTFGGLRLAYEFFLINSIFDEVLGPRGMGYARHLTDILWVAFAVYGLVMVRLAYVWHMEDANDR